MKLLFFAFLIAVATAQDPPAGCTTNGNNGDCTVYITISKEGFGPELDISFSGPTPSQTGGDNAIQFLRNGDTYRLTVKEIVTEVLISFREKEMEYDTSIQLNPSDPTTYTQTVTSHRATFTINLQGYNPRNNQPTVTAFNGGYLPSFTGNDWAAQIYYQDGPRLDLIREYSGRNPADAGSCGSTDNILPLADLGDVASMPVANAFTVVVLPSTGVRARIVEGFDQVCESLPALYVDCHSAPGGGYGSIGQQTGDLFDDNCVDGACNSGLCVAESIIDNECDWQAAIGQVPSVRYGIQDDELVNLTMTIGPDNNQPIFGSGLYRTAPSLPFGYRYNPYILAVSFYAADITYPSNQNPTAKVRTLATSCFSGQQCEFKSISNIARLDLGENNALVRVFQDGREVGTQQLISGEAYFCTLNLPVRATADYSGIVVERENLRCADTDQFCDLGPFYSRVYPHWDCWGDDTGLEAGASYPSGGIRVEVFQGDTTRRLYPPGGSSLDVPFTPVPLSSNSPLRSFQIPNVRDNNNVFMRVSEGACGNGQAPNLDGCSSFDFELEYAVNPHDNSGEFLWTNLNFAGRILSAFELFYLPADNRVTVELLTSPAMDVFRRTNDQGGRPRCYCVLPVVLQSRITENEAACFKSDDVSCVVRERPDQDDDCELCDFLSILRFDLRGLPVMTTNGILRASSAEVTPTPFYSEDFTSGSPTYGGNWVPTEPYMANQIAGVPVSVSAYQPNIPAGSPRDRVSFTVQVPSYTTSVQVSYDAFPFGSGQEEVVGAFSVVGSESGTLVNQGLAEGAMNLQAGQWTPNQSNNLVVLSGETLTITFYATNPAPSVQLTPLVHNIVVTGNTFNVRNVRNLFQIGGVYQNITVLRNCHCDTPQQYWLEITDNVQAVKEQNTQCCSKDCLPFHDPFTRVMCLDLQDMELVTNQSCIAGRHPYPAGLRVYDNYVEQPTAIPLPPDWFNPTVSKEDWQSTEYDGCGYLIRNRLTTSIFTVGGSEPFRVRARQGGYDGCALQAQCTPWGGCPTSNGARKRSTGTLRSHKRSEQVMADSSAPANNFFNGNSWYTVLCLPYTVRLNEYTQTKETSVNCVRGASCRAQEVLVGKLLVDTECEGDPTRENPQVHSGDLMQLQIVANSSWPDEVLEYNADKGVYPGIGFDVTLLDASGNQIRGKRSKVFHKPNCTFDRWAWSSATCLDCGYRQNYFTVLAQVMQVRVNEVPYADRPVEYPDRRMLPRKTNTVDCTAGTCAPTLGSMFSRLWVQSFRGLPSEENGPANFRYMVVKFGNSVQTPLRVIDESWLWQNPSDQPNAVCVIADSRGEYAINWGLSYASDGASNPFADCSSLDDNTIDNCRQPGSSSQLGAIIVPPLSGKKNAQQQKPNPLVKAAMERVMKEQQ